MALATLPFPNMDFVPLDILTANELDQLVANIEAINNTTSIDTLIQQTFFYKTGDTITLSQSTTPPLNGLLTGGKGTIELALPVKKRLDNISTVTCTAFTAGIRCNDAYLGGANDYNFLSNATSSSFTIDQQTNTIYINFTKSSGWGGTNNSAISAGNTNATFALS